MKLNEFYNFVVKAGMRQDPRSAKKISAYLKEQKSAYNKLSSSEKKYFDKEKLTNPYADTRILYGNLSARVKRILVGVDIDVAELLLADRISKNKHIDCALSHHPQGYAYASFYEVMNVQADMLIDIGISPDVAKDLVEKRKKEVERKVHAANHQRAVDAAGLLNIPFMCAHTVADNFVANYLKRLFNKSKPKLLKDVLKILNSIPEYKIASSQGAGPKIILGDIKKRAGKIALEMTGGTEGPKNIFGRLSQAGVSTIVCMHLSEEHFRKLTDEHINVVVAGHISSDNLGMNLLLDKVEKRFGKLDIIPCSGFRRIKRG